ncbi:MAG: 4Fe-4S dicluster domain-containing protein [Planctomycetota bacterium]
MSSSHAARAETLPERMHQATGESVFECYQCGKCTAGCPLAAEMDYSPNQIIRLLQLGLPGLVEEALRSLAVWLCLTCEQCATRCPQEVELPKIMEYLRQQALKRGTVHPEARDILAFHESFLDTLRRGGRLHEVSLIAEYKLKTGHFLQDVLMAPLLLARGKLGLLPHGIEGKEAVKRIFEKCEAAEH